MATALRAMPDLDGPLDESVAGTANEVGDDVAEATYVDEVIVSVGRGVCAALRCRPVTVVLWLGGMTHVWRSQEERGLIVVRDDPYPQIHALLDAYPERTWILSRGRWASHPPDALIAALLELDALGARVVVPLASVVPPTEADRVVGGLILGSRSSRRALSQTELRLLRTVAQQAAFAIGNARLYRQLQESNQRLAAQLHTRAGDLDSLMRQLSGEVQTLYRQLLLTEKMASLGRLAAGIAHEINNTVSCIAGNAEPVRRHIAAVQSLAARHRDAELDRAVALVGDALDVMTRAAERTAVIVADLRTFTHVGGPARRPVDLNDGIQVSIRLLRSRWEERISIRSSYGDLPPVHAVPGQINQVFMNLLANACDAIEGRGHIWINTTARDGTVEVVVGNDGPGIPRERLQRIFDPFYTTKPIGKGTGLGLALCRQIISDHGGSIRVASDPGAGTIFTVTIPVGRVDDG